MGAAQALVLRSVRPSQLAVVVGYMSACENKKKEKVPGGERNVCVCACV